MSFILLRCPREIVLEQRIKQDSSGYDRSSVTYIMACFSVVEMHSSVLSTDGVLVSTQYDFLVRTFSEAQHLYIKLFISPPPLRAKNCPVICCS